MTLSRNSDCTMHKSNYSTVAHYNSPILLTATTMSSSTSTNNTKTNISNNNNTNNTETTLAINDDHKKKIESTKFIYVVAKSGVGKFVCLFVFDLLFEPIIDRSFRSYYATTYSACLRAPPFLTL